MSKTTIYAILLLAIASYAGMSNSAFADDFNWKCSAESRLSAQNIKQGWHQCAFKYTCTQNTSGATQTQTINWDIAITSCGGRGQKSCDDMCNSACSTGHGFNPKTKLKDAQGRQRPVVEYPGQKDPRTGRILHSCTKFVQQQQN